jgi:hypothetical protein
MKFFAASLLLFAGLGAHAELAASGDYFRDFGVLVADVRSVRWTSELCAERHPETAPAIQQAVAVFDKKHAGYMREVEAQWPAIEAYWAQAPGKMRDGMTFEQLKAAVENQKEGLRAKYEAAKGPSLLEACRSFPKLLRAREPEQELAGHLATMRRGIAPAAKAKNAPGKP